MASPTSSYKEDVLRLRDLIRIESSLLASLRRKRLEASHPTSISALDYAISQSEENISAYESNLMAMIGS